MTRICDECHVPLQPRKRNYHYKQCGLSNVVLKDIVVEECAECGGEYPNIPASSQLHRAIMIDLLKKDTLLTGEEIRFFRKMANLKATDLAKLMGVTSIQVSKWENNARPISPTSDRVLRLICYSGLLERMLKNRSLDVRQWLKSIERESKGSKRVMIDPRRLAEFGMTPDASASDSAIQ